jgi:5-formyltetrahydrofolate cyclo-ligase
MNTAIVTLKKQLRKDMAARLEQLSTPELIKQCNYSKNKACFRSLKYFFHILADQVFQNLQQLNQFQASKNISIYISMPTCEIMTANIIQHLLRSSK